MIKKVFTSLEIVLLLSFVSCGGGNSSKEEIKKVSDELVLDKNETEIITQQNSGSPTPTSTAQTFKSTIKKTGQTTSYEQFDDGHYQIGVTPSYSRSGEVVTDNITGLQWQDNEETKTVWKNWEDAKSYCLALSLGGSSDWRLPTRKELKNIVDYGNIAPAINSVFQNVTNDGYWSSTTDAYDSFHVWSVSFYNGSDHRGDKGVGRVRCVRGGQ